MRFNLVVAAAAIALIAVAGASGALQKGGNSLHAALSGKVEVPKGDPDGRGTAEVKINGTSVCWEIKASKVAKLLAAHIHKGNAGVAGPVVVPFGKAFKSKGCIRLRLQSQRPSRATRARTTSTSTTRSTPTALSAANSETTTEKRFSSRQARPGVPTSGPALKPLGRL